MRRNTVGLAAAAVGCGVPIEVPSSVQAPRPLVVAEVVAPAEPAAGDAHCSLPEDRPTDWVVGATRSQQGHGTSKMRFQVRLLSPGTECDLDLNCISASPEALDAAWKAVADADFEHMRVEPATGSPHAPAAFVMMTWGDQRCEVGQWARATLPGSSQQAFESLVDRVFELAAEQSPTPLLRETTP